MRIFILSLFFCICCHAQEFTYFNQSYGTDSMNIFSTVVEPIEDGYLVLGPYRNTENHALYIRKIDKKGRSVWFKNLDETFLGDIITTGRQVIKIDEKHFAVAYTYIYNDEDWRVQLVKFNIEGDVLFHREFADPQIIRNARQLITTYDKGFVFVGAKKVYNPLSNTTFYMIKTDSLGNKEWEKTYTYEDFLSIAYSVQQTPDGGYILGGYARTGWANKDDEMFIVKTDSLGNEEWSKTIGGAHDDCPAIVHCRTSLEEYQQTGWYIEYLISGCYIEDRFSKEDRQEIYFAILGPQGDLIWEEGHSPFDISYRLDAHLMLPDKSFYGVGSINKDFYDTPVLYRFDLLGQLLWKKELLLDTLSDVYARDIQLTQDGGLILTGFRFSPNPQKSWVLKLDMDGNTCMPADCDSTIVFTDIEAPLPRPSFSLSLYPNPASEKVEVVYQIPKDGILKVYDYQGRLIDSWKLKMDNSSLTLKVGDWTSGIYLYTVEIEGERIEHGKILCR